MKQQTGIMAAGNPSYAGLKFPCETLLEPVLSIEEIDLTSEQADLLRFVTGGFLHSRDFNGVPVSSIETSLHREIEPLVEQGLIYANFGHVGVNPHIMMFPNEVPLDNLAVVREHLDSLTGGVLYPTRVVMDQVLPGDKYADAPYSRELQLGEAQIEPLFFQAQVLERYRNDPRFDFEFDIDGSITTRDGDDEHHLTALGIGFHKESDTPVVVALRRYLHDMPGTEQQHWRIHRIAETSNYALHPDFVKPHYEGDFPEKLSPYSAILQEIDLTNEICAAIGWGHLYRKSFDGNARPKNFGYLIRPTLREFQLFILELDKILSDNLGVTVLRKCLETDGKNEDGSTIGSISLLETLLKNHVRDDPEEMIPKAIALFRRVRNLRQRPAHASDQDAWDEDYYRQQNETVVEAYFAVRSTRQLLGCHTLAESVAVPSYLDKAEVWPF